MLFEKDGRMFNKRQEEERSKAQQTSESNKRTGNANASKSKRAENANAFLSERDTANTRAYECGSGSTSEFVSFRKESAERKPNASERFAEFWDRYPLKDVSENLVAGVWLGVVTVAEEPAMFACLARYLESDQVARGIVKTAPNWLHDCARAGWACEWPAAMKPNGTAGKMTEAEIKAAMLAARKEKRT
jgi:hypothetical protein